MIVRAVATYVCLFGLVSCGEKRPPAQQQPTQKDVPAEKTPGNSRFEANCSTNHAPRPEIDAAPMCLVPAGEFMMGTPADSRVDIDGPPRRVRITRPFYLDQFELTVGQYAAFLRAGGDGRCTKSNRYCLTDSEPDGIDVRSGDILVKSGWENMPIEQATFEAAETFCVWAGKRLPTSAQWEFAARHDPALNLDRVYPWGNEYRAGMANHFEAIEPKRGRVVSIGTFSNDRSATGIMDMGGNVSEWVADCYSFDTCGEPCIDPIQLTNCKEICSEGTSIVCASGRVLRGHSIVSRPPDTLTKRRDGVMPDWGAGVRCARSTH